MTIQILNPVENGEKISYDMPARLDTLDGKTIGIYSNGKLNADLILEKIVEELSRHGTFEVRRGVYSIFRLMEPQEWVGVDECDAIILANGDCGACSSSGIANAVDLEKRGIPTMLVSTPPFFNACEIMAGISGMPDLRWAVVEHPIGSCPPEAVADRARSAADQFRSIILAPAPAPVFA